MRVIRPEVYRPRQETVAAKRKKPRGYGFVLLLLAAVYVIFSLRVNPFVAAQVQEISVGAGQTTLKWPKGASVSAGVVGIGDVGGQKHDELRSTASTIKVLTALTVLKAKPISATEQGPQIVFDEADAARYQAGYVAGESGVPVNPGKSISEYQALEALLMGSANNMADKLAVWAYGSMDSYLQAANTYARDIGMTHTVVADASGLDAGTKSTTKDMLALSMQALENPVITKIVAQKSVDFPDGVVVTNTNKLLGNGTISGLKTGYTDEAGGCVLLSSTFVIDGKTITVAAAVMGQSTRDDAYAVAKDVIDQVQANVSVTKAVVRSQKVGEYIAPWGERVDIVAAGSIDVIDWPGKVQDAQLRVDQIKSRVPAGQTVGSIQLGDQEVKIVTTSRLRGPSYAWRLTHIFAH